MKIKRKIYISDSKCPMPGEYVKIRNNIYYCIKPIEYDRCTGCDLMTPKINCFSGTNIRCFKDNIHNVIFKKYE